MAKKELKIKSATALSSILNKLTDYIHPLVLADFHSFFTVSVQYHYQNTRWRNIHSISVGTKFAINSASIARSLLPIAWLRTCIARMFVPS